MHKPSVLILAAGYSSRIRKHKFALKFNEKSTFVERLVSQYKSLGCKKIIVVLNAEGVKFFQKNLPHLSNEVMVITNMFPERGRSYSISLGLKHIPGNEKVFIQNVDNPFITTDILKLMLENLKDYDCVSPQYQGEGGHPVLISHNVIKEILVREEKDFVLRDLLKNFKKRTLPVNNQKILANINTMEDYNKYF